MIKYYAIRKGYKIGIFTSFDKVKLYTENYIDAEYKKFNTLTKAEKYLAEPIFNNNNIEIKKDVVLPIQDIKKHIDISEEIEAYIDGSYNTFTKRYGFGIVLVNKNKIIYQESRIGKNTNYIAKQSVAGEIFGAILALKYALQLKLKKIKIYYDFTGIEQWAKQNKPNNDLATLYNQVYQEVSKYIMIEFEKIKAHSNNTYHDIADKLAKQATSKKLSILDTLII